MIAAATHSRSDGHAGPEATSPLAPRRTCVGCQQVTAQGELLRGTVDAAGRLRFDGRQRESGRGVYLHRNEKCLQAAMRSGFARSLRRKVLVDEAAARQRLLLALDGTTVAGADCVLVYKKSARAEAGRPERSETDQDKA